MSEIKNLWSEELLSESDLISPKTILQQQVQFFNEMTKNVVIAEIHSKAPSIKHGQTKKTIAHILEIAAPALGNYDFVLISVVHEELLAYPVKVFSFLEDNHINNAKLANNPEELIQVLEKIFKSKKVISAIQNVIALSK